MFRAAQVAVVTIALVAVVTVTWASMCQWAFAQPAAKTSAESQKQAARLVAQFRAAKRDTAKREKIIEEAVAGGVQCVAALQEAIEKELEPSLSRYASRFLQQAQALAKKKLSNVDLQEVAKLRQAVLSIQTRIDFTSEALKKDGEPAMRRLEEIFLVDPDQVLQESEALQAERKQLEELGKLWERCAVYLYEQQPADETKPKDPPTFDKYVRGEELLQCGMAVPMDPQTRQVMLNNAKLAAKLDPEEARAILATNIKRNLLGLPPLVVDLALCAAARDHSADMERLNFFGHESKVPGKRTWMERAMRFGTTCVNENLCKGSRDGKAVIDALFYHPGSHANIVSAVYKRMGVGISGVYFTQKFGN